MSAVLTNARRRIPAQRLAAVPATFAIGLAALLGGCSQADPYTRDGMWQPVGANVVNLAKMVERPADLLHGRGTQGSAGIQAVPPVNAIWTGKLTPLPDSSSTAGVTGPAGTAPVATTPGGGT